MLHTIPDDLYKPMLEEFKTGWNMRKVMAEAQQQELGKVNHQQHKSVDGLGRLRMRVDADSYHFWGQKLGYQCWQDNDFINGYERDNPACRVKSGGTKLQFGNSGSSNERRVKFRKVFA